MDPRPRPRLHFTPRAGWINDPHGIVHAGGRYHLFFQYNPAGIGWAPAIRWGHAVSADLLTWEELPVALEPGPGEVGCWSGSLVLDGDVPTILYTRVTGPDLALGQVAVARGTPDLAAWRRDPPAAVVAGPPAGLGVRSFRDPFVWAAGDGWRMIVGAGLDDGSGAAIQYRSADLVTWTPDGVLARRPATETAGSWTGAMWECPQLFELDGTWVLLVSVWADEVLHHVAYGLGDYDGATFTARTWGSLSHGDQLYATTAFRDADGRRCVLSWLREPAAGMPAGSPWAGAHSLPRVLGLDGDRLVATPHPNLAGHGGPATVSATAGAPLDLDPLGTAATVVLETAGAATVTRGSLTLAADPAGGTVTVTQAGTPLLVMPAAAAHPGHPPRLVVRMIVDADILEVTVDGVAGVGATRCAAEPDARVTVRPTGTPAALTVRVTRYPG